MSIPQTVTMRQAAERLGVSHDKMYRMVKSGQIRAQANPLDRREKLILLSDLQRFLEAAQPQSRHFVSDGIASVADAVPSDRIKEWVRQNWRPS